MTSSPSRLRIAVLFGGRSSEHDVSVLSATNVMGALDPERYDALPVFVTRDGRWLQSRFADGALARPESGTELCLVPGGRGRLLAIAPDGKAAEAGRVDIVFPARLEFPVPESIIVTFSTVVAGIVAVNASMIPPSFWVSRTSRALGPACR